jgi:prophage regulatory protein
MDRIIGRKELLRLVPYSLGHIYRLEAAGEFPRRVHVGASRVGWIESELESWIEARKQARG